jgi:hypothetical protein
MRIPEFSGAEWTQEEALETTKIHSVAGLLGPGRSLVATRRCRAPHHTISGAGLIGGGKKHPGRAARGASLFNLVVHLACAATRPFTVSPWRELAAWNG